MISAHSHAFHRGMRGRSHIGATKQADSFWGWRNDMYEYVQSMNRQQFYDICYTTFEEMLSNGITTVGEFHYFHHDQLPYQFDEVILQAAYDANIR